MTDACLQRWTPALRRAVMKVRPEYFGWSRKEQERYGVAIPEPDHDRLSQALLEELWGRKIRAVEKEKAEVISFVRKEHDELQRTFDPKVVRLRKRRTILVHKDAFDDVE